MIEKLSDDFDYHAEIALRDAAIARNWLLQNDAQPDSVDILARELLAKKLIWVEKGDISSYCGPNIFQVTYSRFFKQPQAEVIDPQPEVTAPPAPEPPPTEVQPAAPMTFAQAHPELLNANGLPRSFSELMTYARYRTINPTSKNNPSVLDKLKQRKGSN